MNKLRATEVSKDFSDMSKINSSDSNRVHVALGWMLNNVFNTDRYSDNERYEWDQDTEKITKLND